jgi:beta-phosphoglucomutase
VNKPFRAVIFDMDGVLVDSEWQYHLRRLDFLREHGVELPQETLPQVIGRPYQSYVDMVLSLDGVSWTQEEYTRLYDAYTQRIGRLHYDQCLFSDAPGVLSLLKRKGLRLGLASSSPRRAVSLMLSDCGFGTIFHCVLAQEDVEQVKPSPEIYRKAAARLDLSPEECVAVEDSVHGIRSALDAGMTVVAKTSPHYELDQSAAHYHIRQLQDLPPLLERL